MFRHRTPLAIHQIRDYLADREGLSGAPRRGFFELLDHYRAFLPVLRPLRWGTLLLCSLGLCLLAVTLDTPPRDWLDVSVWPVCLVASLIPIFCVRRLELHRRGFDPETEWRAYCLFLRPIILQERPGLLDRNLAPTQFPADFVRPRPLTLLRDLLRVQGLDYWWSSVVGLWCGMAALLILRHLAENPDRFWTLLLPVAGGLFGPMFCALWQAAVYAFALFDPRLRDHRE